MNKKQKSFYETPSIEVVKLQLEESIAASMGGGASFFEDIWGPKE